MKLLLIILLFILSLRFVAADEEYTDMIYTSVTMLYWCIYKDMPKNKEEVSKVTNIDEPNKNIIVGFDQWLSTISHKIDGGVLIITRGNKSSKSNCASVEIIKK